MGHDQKFLHSWQAGAIAPLVDRSIHARLLTASLAGLAIAVIAVVTRWQLGRQIDESVHYFVSLGVAGMVLVALRPDIVVLAGVTLVTLTTLAIVDGWPTVAEQWVALFLFLAAMALLWRNHHRTLSRARDLADGTRMLAAELNLLIDGAEDYAIYMLDAEGRVTIWNGGAERLKGWTEAEMAGQLTDRFYPADVVASGKPTSLLAEAQHRGKIEIDEWQIRKDGSEFLAHISITALKKPDGSLGGFATIVHDITDQRATLSSLRMHPARRALS